MQENFKGWVILPHQYILGRVSLHAFSAPFRCSSKRCFHFSMTFTLVHQECPVLIVAHIVLRHEAMAGSVELRVEVACFWRTTQQFHFDLVRFFLAMFCSPEKGGFATFTSVCNDAEHVILQNIDDYESGPSTYRISNCALIFTSRLWSIESGSQGHPSRRLIFSEVLNCRFLKIQS